MAKLRTIVIAKTDIVSSTARVSSLSGSELSAFLNQHKKFILDIVAQFEGSRIKGEGDAFWITFPSVTTAALAAIEMHQQLRLLEAGHGEDKRLAIRVVINVGDALAQDNDFFGNVMNSTARIESITPPDEIYLSHAAWLILNKAEVQTSFVNQFTLKGFQEPEKIYKVEKSHRTRIITDQVIILVDARGWTSFVKSNTIEAVESVLLHLDDLINKVCNSYGGIIRNVAGDLYVLTFDDAQRALIGMAELGQKWEPVSQKYGVGLAIGIHKGQIYILRSYIYGNDINIAGRLESLNPAFSEKNQISILLSQRVEDEIYEPKWKQKLRKINSTDVTDASEHALIEEYGAYQYLVA